ncbi:hypothetical protein [Verrucosispora sp. WMMC514]|uniref:hypothetical protein n=1 Tax=Verrucosispora sp. WMMC514 TaxID=3015156 RepID=UPI00248C9DDB|nr:hypothetical protein [Verrucosispora sp. WMMC514]WBB94171.1 hypothetical protein O7597_15080 [Verrucosispora sp. WMMC514]
MALIDDSTLSNPLQAAPPVGRIARQTTGVLWFTMISNAGNSVLYYRSTNGGSSWTYAGGWNFGVTIQEISNLHIPNANDLWLAFRTNESGRDRISIVRATGSSSSFAFGNPLKVAEPSHGGTAGSVHNGLEIHAISVGSAGMRIVVAAGTRIGGSNGVTLYGANRVGSTLSVNTSLITGTKQWLYPSGTTGRATPQLDIEHVGDAKSASSSPHLWCSFGRDFLRVVKLAWNGTSWAGPSGTLLLASGLAAQNALPGRWDGSRYVMVFRDPSSTSQVLLLERNQANSNTTQRPATPGHPEGAIRSCTFAYNSVTKDVRVFAVGTSTDVVHYIDYIRSGNTWSSWTVAVATGVIGGSNYSVRRESHGSAKYDIVTAHTGSPHTIVSTHLSLSYAPTAPTWRYGVTAQTPPANGAAMDVAMSMRLDWLFADPDPSDTQSAWALSRQIGTGTIQYFRASDNTWQASEQKNTGSTQNRTLTTGQWVGGGGAGDPAHTYRVRVWDTSDTPSPYSTGLVIVPAAKVDPTITSPAVDGDTWTSGTITVIWSVAEQTGYRVHLIRSGLVLFDSEWRGGGATSYAIPLPVADGQSYTIRLWTRSAAGLASSAVDRTVVVDYTEPAEPIATPTPMPHLGLIRVTVTNPAPAALLASSFEVDLTGWVAWNGAHARVNDWASDGSWSVKVTPSGSGTAAYTQSPQVAAAAGQPYTGWVTVRPTTSDKPAAAMLHWFDGSGVYLSSTTVTSPAEAGVAQQLTVTGAAPASTGFVAVAAGVASAPTAGDIVYVDDVRLMGGAVPQVVGNDIQRRPAGVDGAEVTVARDVAAGGGWDDWTVRSGQEYEYRAVAVGSNGTAAPGLWSA